MAVKPKVVTIVQARMSSTRLPGKVMREVLGKPLLGYLIERLHRVTRSDKLVIATSTSPEDDEIAAFCQQQQTEVFRGSLLDVLDRYVQAAHQYQAELVMRICSDCPLFDPAIADTMIDYALQHHADWTSNVLERSYPRGMDVEVCSMKALERAHREGIKPEEREHVTPFLYRHPELFSLANYIHTPSYPQYRLCVDTAEDFELIRRIFEALYPKNPYFTLEDILRLLETHPDWLDLNAHIQQKTV